MTVKITQRIKGFKVVDEALERPAAAAASTDNKASKAINVVEMDESLQRPETLIGMTYKIKSPLFEHALYVTVNDIVLNAGTPHEQRRPFEIFINSKNMDHFQWIVALTRIMSAVFRKGGDCTFLVEELKAVFDPRGGYLKKGGVYMPSIVAEIGAVLERHLIAIGMLEGHALDETQLKYLAEKRAAYEASQGAVAVEPGEGFPAGAQLCNKCNTQAVVQMDGCATCLNCGNSKCG
ncbi:NrdJb [Pseudomonas songnenensis]|uniref:ribonucleoside-diphosphate reductase n=1 Tax=Pseudomonas songnenensis TaxID=1176259 RepID=A0A482U360_9PSED|nr:NrdJb [Pseudomonas songnenensis]RYJ60875.1 NrdJb [Pseudomonas songnenensis]